MKKILSSILYSVYALIIIGLIALFTSTPLPIIGEIDVKIVKSGSMEPSIMTGSVVMIKESLNYQVGDVITFAEKNGSIPTTHRIVGTEMVDGKEYFLTKGDANSDIDNILVKNKNIIGKVVLSIPYVGFILDFARQPVGFAFLIGIPAFLIILDEFDKIWREFKQIRRRKNVKESIHPLVVAPYESLQSQKCHEARVVTKTPIIKTKKQVRLMDIKPVNTPISPQSLKLKEKTPFVNFYQDIKRPHLVAVTSVICLFTFISVQTWGEISVAYFTDTEASLNNKFQAQLLDFSVTPEVKEFGLDEFGFVSDDSVEIEIIPNPVITGDLSYDIASAFVDGDVEFCENLVMNSFGAIPYVGYVTHLDVEGVGFTDVWNLSFVLFDNNRYFVNEVCEVDLVFKGYLATLSGGGYVVEKKISLVFRTEVEDFLDKVDFQISEFDLGGYISDSDHVISRDLEEIVNEGNGEGDQVKDETSEDFFMEIDEEEEEEFHDIDEGVEIEEVELIDDTEFEVEVVDDVSYGEEDGEEV